MKKKIQAHHANANAKTLAVRIDRAGGHFKLNMLEVTIVEVGSQLTSRTLNQFQL